MTDLPSRPADAPRELMRSSRDLAHHVRAAQRNAWFPLLVFGLITLGSVPVNRFGHYSTTCSTSGTGPYAGRVCAISSTASFVYWPIALLVAYIAISLFYAHRSRERGVGTRVRPYVIVGIVLAAVFTAASLWAAKDPIIHGSVLGLSLDPGSAADTFLHRVITPAAAIGLALLVLARIERDRMLFAFTVLYLVVVLAKVDLGWTVRRLSPWFSLPHVIIPAALLLLGSLAFARLQPHRPPEAGS